MKRLYYTLVTALLLASCSEASRQMFSAPDAIYFRMPLGDTTLIIREDTVVYSFAFEPVPTTREICIPVEVIGYASGSDRKYLVEVTEFDGTRAGTHYEAISAVQVLPAGKTRDSLRVTFLCTPDMRDAVKKIGITIRPGEDFAEGVNECLHVAVQVSDILERPTWWNDSWNTYFGGTYDPQIYKAWMTIYGGKGDLTAYPYPSWWDCPQVLTAVIDLKRYFDENEVYYLKNPSVRIVIPYPS
jgi:hypothetical protein